MITLYHKDVVSHIQCMGKSTEKKKNDPESLANNCHEEKQRGNYQRLKEIKRPLERVIQTSNTYFF